MVSRAAGDDVNLIEGIEVIRIPLELVHDDGLAVFRDALAHRVTDSLRLLVDFLEHEVLVTALLGSLGIPVDLKDLLDSVDLNTYGLRRTSLNETITLDAGESVIDPNKPVMVNAGGNDDDPTDPLDKILADFNERWFKGWDATPDDQKAKMIGVAKAVANDEDYQTLVVGNPDQQAVAEAMISIVDRIMRKQRKGDMSLYKEYQQNEGFKHNFIGVIDRMLENLEYIR